ncbi:MAG: ABC transporter permease [Candidatus Asgardarchaeia archaeon]
MGKTTSVIYAMWYRQIKRFLRAKSRVVSAITQPLLWMFFFGIGFSAAFKSGGMAQILGTQDYLSFIVPGIIMMTIFASSFMSGVSVIFDREVGFLKEVLVAPTSRKATIIGRTLGDATINVLQGAIIAIIAYPLAPSLNLWGLPLTLAYGFLMSIAFASVGILIASSLRSMEAFQMVVNFIMMPLLFLSNVFYPLEMLPSWMKIIVLVNPLTFAVDASRSLLMGISSIGLLMDSIVLVVSSMILIIIATSAFERTSTE